MKNLKNQPGYVAFISLLVVSAAALAIAVSVALMGVGGMQSSLGTYQGERALKVAESGVEEALLRLRDDATWDPNGGIISLPGLSGDCSIEVSGTGNSRTILSVGEISGPPRFVRRIQVEVKRTGNSLVVLSWQEI